MTTRNLFSFFRKTRTTDDSRSRSPRSRSLRLENLEDRALLSVTPLEYAAIRDAYPNAELAADMSETNVVEFAQYDVDALNAALKAAAQDARDDVFVIRDVANASDANETVQIELSGEASGSVTIVGLAEGGSEIADFTAFVASSDYKIDGAGGVFNGRTVVPLVLDYANSTDDAAISIQTTETKSLIGINELRADSDFSFADGTGYTTVIIDTGINNSHEYFKDADGNSRIVYQYDYYYNDADATDYNGHGSNVAGIVAGKTGIAPNANIIALKVGSDDPDSPYVGSYQEALQWVVANAEKYNIVSVNLSLGGGNYARNFQEETEFQTLNEMGVIVCCAAGNSFCGYGSAQGLAYPAADPYVVSVGATFDADQTDGAMWSDGATAYTIKEDQVTPFSQRSATMLTTMAPGAWLDSAGAGASDATTSMTGTSQATPVVTGVATLAQQIADRYLGRRLTVEEFKELLNETGVTIYDSASIDDGAIENDNVVNTEAAYKRIDAYALAQKIMTMAPSEVDDAYEPNDSSEEATELGTISTAKEISAIAGPESNVDWYSFSLTEEGSKGSRVEVDARYIASAYEVALTVYDANLEIVGSSAAASKTQKVSLEGLAAGTYFVKVQNLASIAGSVSYTLKIVPVGSSTNLTFYQPTEWSDSVVVSSDATSTTGETSFTQDQEIFVRSAFATTKSFTTSFRVSLYVDSLYRTSWDVAGLAVGKYKTTGDLGYSLGKLSAGNHKIKFVLDEYNAIDETDETDNERTVSIKVVGDAARDDAYEPNDFIGEASDLGTILTTKTIAELVAGEASNRDWYKFEIDADGTADSRVELKYVAGENAAVDLYLCDGFGNVLASSRGGAGSETISLEGRAAGTYFLEAYNRYDVSTVVDYSLTIVPPVPTPKTLVVSVDANGGSTTFDLAANGFAKDAKYCLVCRDKASWFAGTVQAGNLTYTVGKQTTFAYSSDPLTLTVDCPENATGKTRTYTATVKLDSVAGDDFAFIEIVQKSIEIPLTRVGTSTAAPQVGKTISTTLYNGSTKLTDATAEYVWFRVDSEGSARPIADATSSTYTPVAADAGYNLRVVATGTGAYKGTVTATHKNATIATLTRIGTSTSAPEVGETISTTLYNGSSALPDATATYQWYRVDAKTGAATKIAGATASTYAPVAADAGYNLRVVATGTGSYKGTVAVTHKAATTATLTRIGTSTSAPEVGKAISTTLYDGSSKLPNATAKYQWYRVDAKTGSAKKIAGATGSTYTPVAADAGYNLRVVATGTGVYKGTVAATHKAATVAALTRVGTSTLNPTVGVEITTTLYNGSSRLPNATATYQWYRVDAQGNETIIEGATESTYTPTATDVGYRLRVSATGTGCYSGAVTATHARATVAGKSSAVLDDAFAAFDWEDELVEF